MLVLHGVWRGADRLCLWAEDSARPATPPRRPGRPPRRQPHPFAVPHDDVPDELAGLAAKAAAVPVTLLLPTRAGGPVASPELVRTGEELADRGPVTLRPWSVPMWEYDQDDALAVLRDLDRVPVTLGADLRHLRAVADFAADLVSRGRLLPTVLPAGDKAEPGAAAVWRPVLTGEDAAWARSLALALPPVGRALAEEPAGTVTARALDALVDAAARAALETLSEGEELGTGWRGALTGR
ncbi:MAG: ATP-dependent helicase, partial [Micromonosporaceae bacterium]|nr:ATP-dependent helicase [Micromonosporaceae bacterium]